MAGTAKAKSIILLSIIVLPLFLIISYESWYLQTVHPSDQFQAVQTLKSSLHGHRAETSRQIDSALTHLLENSSSVIPVWEQFKLTLQTEAVSALWLSPLSLHRKINILNLVICTKDRTQTIPAAIKRGLQWFNREYSLNLTVVEWTADLLFETLPSNSLIVVVQELNYDFLDQNMANKLRKGEHRNPFYLPEMVKELRSTSLFSHCKFTNIACKMKSILFSSPLVGQGDSYLSIQDELFLLDRQDEATYFNVLADCLGLTHLQQLKSSSSDQQLVRKVYHLLIKHHFLIEGLQLLDYLLYTFEPIKELKNQLVKKWKESPQKLYDFLLKGRHLSPYIHNPEEKVIIQHIISYFQSFLHQNITEMTLLQLDPMTDMRVGRMDMFPNNFKVGVYLPLLILFCYPLAIISKYLVTRAASG